jgi:hypothetical protein
VTNVDWGLLADHLGGALEGTPEGDRVAHLVGADPGWARAAAELSVAFGAVAADLRTLPPPRLPDDIAARLDSALRAAIATAAVRPPPGPRTGPGGGAPPGPLGGHGGTGRPGAGRPPARPGTRRRRPVRWAAGAAVAAGVVAFAAIGFSGMGSPDLDPGPEQAGAESASDGDGAFAPQPNADGPFVVATGTEYHAPTLGAREPNLPGATPRLGGDEEPHVEVAPQLDAPAGDLPPTVPDVLARLWLSPGERDQCLAMVGSAHGPPPVTVDTVDFARFGGEPAVVVWVTTGAGERWVWVAGPGCGTPAAGPDPRYQARLP